MEELKSLESITEPDVRQRYRVGTIEDLHEIASSVALLPTVPEVVNNQFAIAQNAFVYSWFFYLFLPVADMYSILAIELALNHRLKNARPDMFNHKNPPSLFPLLQAAIEERLLVDDGFGTGLISEHEIVTIDPNNPQAPLAPNDQRYCYKILHILPRLRNGLAHGEYVLTPGSSHSLAIAAALINQLFPMS